jgi:dinuclear metal center YbgI/SA1388 family protein
MITFGELIAALSRVMPPSMAEEWDNSGPQTGTLGKRIGRVHLALDLDAAVLAEAIRLRSDLIVTHHPLVFRPLRNTLDDEPAKAILQELIRRDIAVYSMHTNLDKTFNTSLARTFGVRKCATLDPRGPALPLNRSPGFGSYGNLPKAMSLPAFLSQVRRRLGAADLRVAGRAPARIRKVAFSGGSGGSLITPGLKRLGIDLLLTADIRYHDGQKAAALGLCVVDAGHFQTERILIPCMARVLAMVLPAAARVTRSVIVTDPFQEKNP